MSDSVEQELHEVAAQWDRAVTENDPVAIGRFMAGDWVIVGPDGSVGGKDTFLALVESGDLTHNVMETHEMEVRVYGETAVTVASGVSGGHYRGDPFLLRERSSCVFVRQGGTWRCVLTHLSPLPNAEG
jgi:ketosteroid isomerase-like protein